MAVLWNRIRPDPNNICFICPQNQIKKQNKKQYERNVHENLLDGTSVCLKTSLKVYFMVNKANKICYFIASFRVNGESGSELHDVASRSGLK